MTDCLFCKIAAGEIPANKLLENDDIVVFEDINKVAPHHYLIIPRKHIVNVLDLKEEDTAIIGRMLHAAKETAERTGLDKSGFRLIINTGGDAGEAVHHIHMHFIGGRSMTWPPG